MFFFFQKQLKYVQNAFFFPVEIYKYKYKRKKQKTVHLKLGWLVASFFQSVSGFIVVGKNGGEIKIRYCIIIGANVGDGVGFAG